MSKSEYKRICIQSECAVRDMLMAKNTQLEIELKAVKTNNNDRLKWCKSERDTVIKLKAHIKELKWAVIDLADSALRSGVCSKYEARKYIELVEGI